MKKGMTSFFGIKMNRFSAAWWSVIIAFLVPVGIVGYELFYGFWVAIALICKAFS